MMICIILMRFKIKKRKSAKVLKIVKLSLRIKIKTLVKFSNLKTMISIKTKSKEKEVKMITKWILMKRQKIFFKQCPMD
jgi:hypothetical protein